jgi:hypothetical protein
MNDDGIKLRSMDDILSRRSDVQRTIITERLTMIHGEISAPS